MITRRLASRPMLVEEPAGAYRNLLRAAEAHPDEYFSIAGDKLALLLRELQSPARRQRRRAAPNG